jgi:DNA-binding GntR family transcriptional regulator
MPEAQPYDQSGSDALQRQPLGAQIADQIRRDIIFGRITPGSRLTQEAVCARFATSRVPVRDAFQRLVHEGLLEANASSTRVVGISDRDLDDVFRIEAQLHGLAVRLVVERCSEKDIEALTELNNTMISAQGASDFALVARANTQFHASINRLADSPRLIVALRAVSLGITKEFLSSYPEESGAAIADHRRILAAIRARDADAAAQEAIAHVARSSGDLRRLRPPVQPITAVTD